LSYTERAIQVLTTVGYRIKNSKVVAKKLILTKIYILFVLFNAVPDENNSALSWDEQEWLDKNNEIIFVSQSEYPPFEFINKENQSEGMCIELVHWIATEFGFKARFRDMPFLEAQQAVLTGEADVLTSLFYSKARDDYFDFSQMTWSVPALIFVPSERPDIKELQDLNGKRVAIQHGDYAEDFLKSKNISYTLIPTKTFTEAINMVITGQADAVIGDKQIVLYNLFSKNLMDKVKSVGEPLYIGQNAMAVQEGKLLLQSILNKGLLRAQQNGVFSKLTLKWIGTHYTNTPKWYDKYLSFIFLGIGFLTVIILFISVLYFQLRRIVNNRTRELRISELHLKSLYKSIPDLLWLKDSEGRYLNCNHRFEQFFGAPEKDIVGKTDYDFVDRETADLFRFNDQRAVEAGKPRINEETITYAEDGHEEMLETIKTPVYDEKGNLIGVLGIGHDITERIRAEQKLRESETFLSTIIENIPDMVFVKEMENLKYIRLNKAAEKLLNYTKDELIGRNDYDLLSIEDADISTTKNREILKKGVSVDISEDKIHTPGGEVKILNTKKIPIYINSEKPQYLLGISEDITERKRIEEQLAQAQKMDSIGQLAGGIAHNFNNVLTGIMNAAQLLQSPQRNLDEKGRKYTEMILNASERASDLIGKLLTFGQKAKIPAASIDLDEILNETVDLLYGTMDRNIPISLTTQAEHKIIMGDRSGLENALLNLCINASHAIENGGEIHISSENIYLDQTYCNFSTFDIETGEFCKINVRDTGTGIPHENLKKIFDPFFTTKEQGKGTGLGLSAIYGIVQDHRGEILVKSEVGKGTTFSILLPCSTEKSKEEQEESPVKTGNGLILLVDDEDLNRTLGSEILEQLGYNVLIAESGHEAIRIFKDKHEEIDIVILDMIMPLMTGSEAFSIMKEIDKNCKVIISSGYTHNENIDELIQNNLAKFINKPYKISELSQILDSILKV